MAHSDSWSSLLDSQSRHRSSNLLCATIWACGGIGRLATLRMLCRKACGFESHQAYKIIRVHGAMVAQLTVNQEVVGSSPTAPANLQQENKQQFTYYLSAKKGVAVFESRQARRACSLIGKTCKKFSVISVVSLLVEQPHLRNSRLRGTHGEGRKGLAVTILDSHSKYWGFESFTTDNFLFIFFYF